MSNMNVQSPVRAKAPLSMFTVDIVVIAIAVIAVIASLCIDLAANKADWFPRSGAIAALASAILAYKSISRHYVKFYNNTARGYPLLTSWPQVIIDGVTLVLSLSGTAIWAYGDKWI